MLITLSNKLLRTYYKLTYWLFYEDGPNDLHNRHIDPRYDSRDTWLHVTAAYGTYDQLRAEIYAGGDLEIKERQDNTPLHLAAGNARLNNTRLLLQQGAKPNAKNAGNFTPLDIALGYTGCEKSRLKVAELLIEYGAISDKPNQHGDTAFDIAEKPKLSLSYEARQPHIKHKMAKKLYQMHGDLPNEVVTMIAENIYAKKCNRDSFIVCYQQFCLFKNKKHSQTNNKPPCLQKINPNSVQSPEIHTKTENGLTKIHIKPKGI